MSIYAGVGIGISKNYKLAVAEATSEAKIGLAGKEVSMAVVFTTPEFAFPYLLKAISNLIGATSNAILTQDGIYSHGVAITLISTKEAYSNTAVVKNAPENLDASGEELGKQLLLGMKEAKRCLCLVFSDGKIIDSVAGPFTAGPGRKIRVRRSFDRFHIVLSDSFFYGLVTRKTGSR